MGPRARVEIFHLLFLRSLFAALEDRAVVVLKGGGNLRFYFGSPRFSEDLDLDVRALSVGTLARKVDGLLAEGSALTRVLGAQGIRVSSWSAPKQTQDVQRWKLALSEGSSQPEATKVEFSRRGAGNGVAEAIPGNVLARHRLAGPIVATHYARDDAAAQKVRALIGPVPQARDVFDLNLLLDGGAVLPELTAADRELAQDRALAFGRDEFEGQVLAFLEPDVRAVYASAEALAALKLRVATAIEAR